MIEDMDTPFKPKKDAPPCPFDKLFPSQLSKDDTFYMKLAYNQAIDAWRENEVPIGAVIVYKNQVIAAAHNQVESAKDPTAHAEMLAITQAAHFIGDWRLNDAELYVTKEPCPMCAGAAIMARFGRVIYAVGDPKMGCLGGATATHLLPQLNHRLNITSSILSEECHLLLQTFFQLKRSNDFN